MSQHRADMEVLSVQSTSDDKAVTRHKTGDIALDFATELDAGYEASPEVERRVLRKIDFILLPLISCTATLSFLDKVSNNYANNVSLTLRHLSGRLHIFIFVPPDADPLQYGLSDVLNMHGDQFSWSASVFYFAFMVWQPAVSYINQHYPLGKVVSVSRSNRSLDS